MATLVTHSCFETDMHNPEINNASSYLDLSPLYVSFGSILATGGTNCR